MLSCFISLLPTEKQVMLKTVQPERKLAVATGTIDKLSNTGFIITPPPIPQIAPAVLDKKLTKKTTNGIYSPFNQFYLQKDVGCDYNILNFP